MKICLNDFKSPVMEIRIDGSQNNPIRIPLHLHEREDRSRFFIRDCDVEYANRESD